MLLNPADMKRALCLCLVLFAWTPAAGATTGELIVSGSFVRRPDKGQCIVQLLRPEGEKVATAVISGDFSVRLPYSPGYGPYLVNMTCDGYRVLTSRALMLNAAREWFGAGKIDPNHHLDSDGCRELSGADEAAALKPMILAFEKQGAAPLAKVRVGTPKECTDETYVLLRGIDEYGGPGMHWIISIKKSDGQVTIEQGL
jgi:hypothetical protein